MSSEGATADPIPVAWRAKRHELAAWAARHLLNRRDRWGAYLEPARRKSPDEKSWTAPAKVKVGKVELTDATIAAHFAAYSQSDIIGLHTTGPINTSRAGAVEVDCHGGADDAPADVVFAACRHWHDVLVSLGFSPLMTRSDARGGIHLRTLLDEPTSTPLVFSFLRWLTRDFKSHGLKKQPETFPKQPAIREGKLGNWLRLPGRHHTNPNVWAEVWDGAEWQSGARAVELILATTGNPATLIPSEARPTPPKQPRPAAALPADVGDRVKRCEAYIAKLPDAVSGDHGHNKTFHAAAECYRFGLSDADARAVMDRWNATRTAGEPWDDEELTHKLEDAKAAVNAAGDFGKRLTERDDEVIESSLQRDARRRKTPSIINDDDAPAPADDVCGTDPDAEPEPADSQGFSVLDRGDPLPTARKFIRDHYAHPEAARLQFSGDVFYQWNTNIYAECEPAGLRARMYPWLERHERIVKDRQGNETVVPYQPRKGDIELTLDALKAVAYTPVRSPAWLSADATLPDPARLLVARNGIFTLSDDEGGRLYRPPTPLLFTTNALDYDYAPDAPAPAQWLRFLQSILPGDSDAIGLLQEWAGYCLTADTSQQKMLGLIGPPRSGKGTVARVLARMLGTANVCGPTLSGIGTNFGLWPLVNKRLAIISDARLSGRTDQAIVTERLLSISGEDALTVDRKNLEPITLKLPTRIMVCTNELPRLSDASGALANRFMFVVLRESFLGREDTGLTERLIEELPGVLRWAVDGWQRLRARGHFLQPASAAEAMDELHDLASPVGAFVREWTVRQPGARCACKDLFEAWGCWCKEQGRDSAGNSQVFGRDLRAVMPSLSTSHPRPEDGPRVRMYEGIDLTLSARETLSYERSARQDRAAGRGTYAHYARSV